MDWNSLFQNFQYDDLQWVVPVLAGLLIIVGALLSGIIRGMAAGVIIALFFGGLLAMSPTLVALVEPERDQLSVASAELTQDVAALSQANAEAVQALGKVIQSMRDSLNALEPVVSAAGAESPALSDTGFREALQDLQTEIGAAANAISRPSELGTGVAQDLEALQVELRRLDLEARRLGQ